MSDPTPESISATTADPDDGVDPSSATDASADTAEPTGDDVLTPAQEGDL